MQLKISCKGVVFISKKQKLIDKLFAKQRPKDFTTGELDTLMSQCGCEKYQGGRGSGIKYIHTRTGRILSFDGPHPGNELYRYHIDSVRSFLKDVGEV